jgi:8-oxo-dGTP diphosphatase
MIRPPSVRRPPILPEDEAFVAAYRPSDFPRPSVTVDIVALTIDSKGGSAGALRVLLIQRGEPPFKDHWALPGGFVRVGDAHKERGESLDDAAARELHEETGLTRRQVYLEQLGAFGEPDRDPRMRVITVAYYALVRPDLIPKVRPGGDASGAEWVEPTRGLKLAFDHAEILAAARERIRQRIDASAIAAGLVPARFTIPELRTARGIVTGEPQDPGNFRRRFEAMLEAGIVERAPGERATASKPAAVYRFRRREA